MFFVKPNICLSGEVRVGCRGPSCWQHILADNLTSTLYNTSLKQDACPIRAMWLPHQDMQKICFLTVYAPQCFVVALHEGYGELTLIPETWEYHVEYFVLEARVKICSQSLFLDPCVSKTSSLFNLFFFLTWTNTIPYEKVDIFSFFRMMNQHISYRYSEKPRCL